MGLNTGVPAPENPPMCEVPSFRGASPVPPADKNGLLAKPGGRFLIPWPSASEAVTEASGLLPEENMFRIVKAIGRRSKGGREDLSVKVRFSMRFIKRNIN